MRTVATLPEGDLPHGWAWATPIEVGRALLGKMLDRKKHRRGHSLPYLRNINVRWGRIDLADLLEMFFDDHELERYGIQDGDLLICEGGEPGRCAVWDKGRTDLKFQKALHRLRVKPGVNPYFLMYQIKLDAKAGHLERFFTGSTIKHFTGQSLAKYRFKLAPSREQDRIVEKIDELFSQIEAGEQALERAQKLLERYRQSVLTAAVTGELTRDWRERHKGELESGEALLERILQARRAAWERAELARMRARGKPPRDDCWKVKYKEPTPPDTTDLPTLPEGWVWASVEQFSSDVTYGTSAKCSENIQGVPVLRMGNIVDGQLETEDIKFLPDSHPEFPALFLRPGDLLFNRTNSQELVGKSAVYDGRFSACSFASYLIRVRVECVDARYLSMYINSTAGRDRIRTVVSQQVGQANVNGRKLQSFIVPVPSTAEQSMIIDKSDELISALKHALADINFLAVKSASIRQSILSAAFSGKLVPQDPADEPASVLLERIREERAAVARDGARRGPRRRGGQRRLRDADLMPELPLG